MQNCGILLIIICCRLGPSFVLHGIPFIFVPLYCTETGVFGLKNLWGGNRKALWWREINFYFLGAIAR